MSPQAAPRKLLVMELAGLGDNIHLLPALWKLRQQWPQAQLHLMVNAHVAPLFRLTPWVQQVWAYPNAPKPGLAGNWRWGRRLRKEGYDCVINTNGSDRSSLLCWMTGAPRRIGRRPADGGPKGWSKLFTQVVETPYHREPMTLQKLRCVQQLGIPVEPEELVAPHFEVTIDPALRRAAGIAVEDDGRYIHISPFTTSPARELPLPQLAALITGLRATQPQLRIALSCAPVPRETAGLAALLALLPEPPWRVWSGTLDIPALAAVIAGSALNLSGDTGSLHVALMTGARAVAWFRAHRGQDEWIPRQPGYRVLVAPDLPPREALHGIETPALLAAVAQILHRPGSTG
jgi:ADP-heptose:LPS heptosyltransferase